MEIRFLSGKPRSVSFTVKMFCFAQSSEALKLMNFLHQKEKKQTTRFSGCLEMGTTMKIGCKMFTKVCGRGFTL